MHLEKGWEYLKVILLFVLMKAERETFAIGYWHVWAI